MHPHALIKRGILRFRLGDYASACNDLQGEEFVPVLTQAICHYLVDSKTKAKKLFKDAMTRGQELQLDGQVQKALSKETETMAGKHEKKRSWTREKFTNL